MLCSRLNRSWCKALQLSPLSSVASTSRKYPSKTDQMGMRKYSSSADDILVKKENKVMTVTLNRPNRYNAFTLEMYDRVVGILSDAEADDDVSVVKLTGSGKYYSSGNDLQVFAKIPPSEFVQAAKNGAEMIIRFTAAFIDFPKLLIAAVNGPALGIGVSTLGLFDAVYAAEEATFKMPFSKIGQSPEACSTYTFPKIMGHSKATSMLLFGETISAKEAERLTLVTKVFPSSTFHESVDKEIEKMLQLPLKSLLYSKRLMRDVDRDALHKVNKAECERLIERWTSEDCLNAVMQFLTKSKL